MAQQLEETENQIHESLNELAKELYYENVPNTLWTKHFKKKLRDMGESRGCSVLGSFDDESEWLFDLAWIRKEGSWEDFKGLSMACEMEWLESDKEHLLDFLKLTVCDCDLRLFIFGCKPGTQDDKFKLFYDKSKFSKGKRYMAVAVPSEWDGNLPCKKWET